jgi:hypothetical protein
MHDGLHVGLAAWVGEQRVEDDFVVWPALPLPAELDGIEKVATMADLARSAEFAQLVNFVPRNGTYATPFDAAERLWVVHRELLQQMAFAVRTWTASENAEWNAAVGRLYETGGPEGPRMTREYRRYEECRVAYSDLQASGAKPEELTQAFAEWVVNGKLEIELALATVNRLARRSTAPQAAEQQTLLDPAFLASTSDGTYAATEFAPLSATRPETWLATKVTFDNLERAIGSRGPREKWSAWRSTRSGTVGFRFVALDLRRSWFSHGIYEADDWRLSGEPVSSGDGIHGQLPAYVSSVYLVIVDEVRVDPRPKIDPHSPPIFVPPHLPSQRRFGGQPAEPRLLAAPALTAARSFITSPHPRQGVVLAGTSVPPDSRAILTSPVYRPNLLVAANQPVRVVLAERLALAEMIATQGGSTVAPRPAVAAFVVGFGCTTLPASPNPNPSYQWNSN